MVSLNSAGNSCPPIFSERVGHGVDRVLAHRLGAVSAGVGRDQLVVLIDLLADLDRLRDDVALAVGVARRRLR